MSDISKLEAKIVRFRQERDWEKFHNPKDMALSLVLEASELLEHFQWKNGRDITNHVKKEKEAISDELADVMYWVLLISHDLDINISKAFEAKLKKTAAKYPVSKARGNSKKYTQL